MKVEKARTNEKNNYVLHWEYPLIVNAQGFSMLEKTMQTASWLSYFLKFL